jgi:hypothetical protein
VRHRGVDGEGPARGFDLVEELEQAQRPLARHHQAHAAIESGLAGDAQAVAAAAAQGQTVELAEPAAAHDADRDVGGGTGFATPVIETAVMSIRASSC